MFTKRQTCRQSDVCIFEFFLMENVSKIVSYVNTSNCTFHTHQDNLNTNFGNKISESVSYNTQRSLNILQYFSKIEKSNIIFFYIVITRNRNMEMFYRIFVIFLLCSVSLTLHYGSRIKIQLIITLQIYRQVFKKNGKETILFLLGSSSFWFTIIYSQIYRGILEKGQ